MDKNLSKRSIKDTFRDYPELYFNAKLYEELIDHKSVLAEELQRTFVDLPKMAYDSSGEEIPRYFNGRTQAEIERSKESCMLPTLNKKYAQKNKYTKNVWQQ